MPRRVVGIRNFVTESARFLTSSLTLSILWLAAAISVMAVAFDVIGTWDEPWQTLFWIFLGFIILALGAALGTMVMAALEKRKGGGELTRAVAGRSFSPADKSDFAGAADGESTAVGPFAWGSGPGVDQELQDLGNALRALSEDLINVFFDFQPTPAMSVPAEKEPELAERYERDFPDRVATLYEEARDRGFTDAEIERHYRSPTAYHVVALLAWRFRDLADRVLARAQQ
jgi:hypothetical protein